MKDREIFRRAIKELPSLLLPLLVALGIVQFIEHGGSFLITYTPIFLMMTENGQVAMIASMLCLNIFVQMISCLMSMGCFRLCLARGCGERGTMPWTIFGQWHRYKGWILWMGLVPALWKTGKLFFRVWLMNQISNEAYWQYDIWKANFGVFLSIGSLLLSMLLFLSVRTAYLRAPERGFWRAVLFGIKEGLRKWPRTIGAQLKFVVPFILGIRVASLFLTDLVVGTGSIGMISLYQGAMECLESIWIFVFYGFLAAERYDPPEGTTCRAEDVNIQQGE